MSQQAPPPVPVAGPAPTNGDVHLEHVPVIGFWQRADVQRVMPMATSLLFHILLIGLGLLLFSAVPEIQKQITQLQQVVPAADTGEAVDMGGVENPGINDDPTRRAEQDKDPSATDDGWAERKSQTLNAIAADGSADAAATNTPIGAAASVGGSVTGLNTRGVGESGGPQAPFGKPGGGGGGLTKGMFKGPSGGNASRFVYICDATGSMLGVRMALLNRELKAAIDKLRNTHSFGVIFFKDDSPLVLRPRGTAGNRLLQVNTTNRAAAFEFIDQIKPGGPTNPVPAIEAAFAITSPAPQVIYFMTDATDFPDPTEVIAVFQREMQRTNNQIRVITILLTSASDTDIQSLALAEQTMREIARIGRSNDFRLVRQEDLLGQ